MPRRIVWSMALGVLCFVANRIDAQVACESCAPSVPCAKSCQRFHCPPPLHHCMEGPPRIRYHRGCPRPICPPCSMPNFGYYQPCWRPWPHPPNWSHCPYPTPAANVLPGEHLISNQPMPQTAPIQGNQPTPLPLPRIAPPNSGR